MLIWERCGQFVEIEPEWETRLRAAENLERSRASKEGNTKRELYRFSHMGMWTKLRPGIWNFLAKVCSNMHQDVLDQFSILIFNHI